jgi:hypothetical protein
VGAERPAFVLMPLFRPFATVTPFALASPAQFLPAPGAAGSLLHSSMLAPPRR